MPARRASWHTTRSSSGRGTTDWPRAIHLAAKGWKVGVFERNGVAGGAVQTREATLPGFRHDLFAMNLSLFAGSPFVAAYGAALARHGLAFAPASDAFATAFPDGSLVRRQRGSRCDGRPRQRIIARRRRSAGARWRAQFASDAPHIFGVLGAAMPSFALARVLFKAWRAKGLGWLLDTLQARAVLAARDFSTAIFRAKRSRRRSPPGACICDFPPDIAGGALFPYLESMANQSFGMVIGKGGADMMIKAMLGLLAELGGEVHLNAEVARIDVARTARATGVTLADGRAVRGEQSGHRQCRAGARVRQTARQRQRQAGGRQTHARVPSRPRHDDGASGDERPAGLEGGRGAEALRLCPSRARFRGDEAAPMRSARRPAAGRARAGGRPADGDRPGRAPEGKHVLWVQVRVLPAEIKGDAAGTIAPGDWDAVKEHYADRVIGMLERYAPGVSAQILGRAVFSPKDLERENPNLIGGDSCRRQPPSRPVLPVPPDRRLVAL